MTDAEWIKIAFEIGGMAVIGLAAFFGVKSKVDGHTASISGQAMLIAGIQEEIKKISTVIADQRVADQRVADLTRRISNAEEDIRLLRQGESMILPLHRGAHEVGG